MKCFHLGQKQEFNTSMTLVKGKGKAVLLQAWSSPEGSRKLRFPDFMTKAQDGGKVVSLNHNDTCTEIITPAQEKGVLNLNYPETLSESTVHRGQQHARDERSKNVPRMVLKN